MKKYGCEVYLQSETGKHHMIKKYGVPYAMQCPEIFEKAMKSSFSTKPYIFPSGKVEYIQGYENICIDKLIEQGYDEDDIVVGVTKVPVISYFYDGKNRKYFPDIYIKSTKTLIEVKSTYTCNIDLERNEAKWLSASDEYNFEVYIYNGKKELTEYRHYLPKCILCFCE